MWHSCGFAAWWGSRGQRRGPYVPAVTLARRTRRRSLMLRGRERGRHVCAVSDCHRAQCFSAKTSPGRRGRSGELVQQWSRAPCFPTAVVRDAGTEAEDEGARGRRGAVMGDEQRPPAPTSLHNYFNYIKRQKMLYRKAAGYLIG
eukprot:GSA120T00019522001.1